MVQVQVTVCGNQTVVGQRSVIRALLVYEVSENYTDKHGKKFWSVRYTKDGKRPIKISWNKYGEQKAYMLAVCFFRKLKKIDNIS